ncbi:MAG TPA: hypothetical protein VFC63_26575 [Blastocatellia bacterium]|nr:hypothetical protein [Blastocatellia bacterium]
MKLGKFAAGTITTIIALWIGMWVLKILGSLLVVVVGILGSLFGIAIVVVKVIFICLLIAFVIGIAFLVYSIFFKPRSNDQV